MQKKRILVVTQHFWPENFRINDIVEGFLADGLEVDVLCGLPNYPKGEWFPGYSGKGPWRENYKGANVYRCREISRKGNTGLRIFANYCSWPLFARFSLHRLPGGYDAILCYNTSPVLMNWPALAAGKKFKAPVSSYVLDIWPENLYSVLPVKNKLLRGIAQAVSDWNYRRADRLIAMSSGLRERLLQRTGKQPESVAVIPQYCEDHYAVPQCEAALAAQYEPYFNLAFAGNFSPAQSLDTVLCALKLANERRQAGQKPPHLLLVGDGMSRPALEKLAGELCLEYPCRRAFRGFPRLCGCAAGEPVGFARSGPYRAGQGSQLYGGRKAAAGQHERRGGTGCGRKRRRAGVARLPCRSTGRKHAGPGRHE